MSAPSAVAWRRELPEHVTVTLESTYGDLNPPDEPVSDTRPVGRVVVTMPDFAADDLAHAMASVCALAHVAADLVSGGRAALLLGPLERALAEALAAAAFAAGHHCARPLNLPDAEPGQ